MTDDFAGFQSKPSHGRISVLAGTNGGGKSSVLGRLIEHGGGTFYNPDSETRRLMETEQLDLASANAQAWRNGVAMLSEAIDTDTDTDFALETTLGGANTIPRLLRKASEQGLYLRMAYVALVSADLHVERVSQRVAKGGHDIEEQRIRDRYSWSLENLLTLLPVLDELLLFDNSAPSESGRAPLLILHMKDARMLHACPAPSIPQWAWPVATAVLAGCALGL